jgi:hypothetical protein
MAAARPMPEVAPVMMATLASMFLTSVCFL